jgi:uncharacterized protein
MSATPLQVVKASYKAFAERDAEKIPSMFSPKAEIMQSGDLPWSGVFRGHAGAKEFFLKLTSNTNSTVEVERFITSGDHVVVVGWTQGYVIATGEKYRVPLVHVWKIQNGLITQLQFFVDDPAMQAVLVRGKNRKNL